MRQSKIRRACQVDDHEALSRQQRQRSGRTHQTRAPDLVSAVVGFPSVPSQRLRRYSCSDPCILAREPFRETPLQRPTDIVKTASITASIVDAGATAAAHLTPN